jgi:ankyrin repeat protein
MIVTNSAVNVSILMYGMMQAGLTPLHFAARSGHIDVVRCLLLSGAEPATVNKDELTAEMMAMANGHIDIADLLNKAKFVRFENM